MENNNNYYERPPKKHVPMPIENRAKQFAPFAAITSLGKALEETERKWLEECQERSGNR